MKYNKILYFCISLVGLFLSSCDKVENRVTFLGGTNPQLTASSTSDLVLTKATENYSSLQFQWTNPNYLFSNGVNTEDVNYLLEIDTTGSNFSNPKRAAIGFTKDVNTSFTVKALNTALSTLELPDYTPHDFEFRVKATLNNGSVPVYSNVVKIRISTYLDVVYPVPDHLYIVGDATPTGWTNNSTAPDATQTFTKINSYTFQLSSLAMTPNQFLFIPVAGDWTHKYAFDADSPTNNPMGDYFKPDAKSNFQAPAAGNYQITVNFKTGKYSLVKL